MEHHFNKYFQVLYEDNHLLIVNKEPGVLVQGDQTKDEPLVEMCRLYIKGKYNKPGNVFMGLVHRLDRPVSGIVVLARTSKGLERMNEVFRNRKVHKIYWAVTKRKPRPLQGKLTDWLLKDTTNNTVSVVDADTKGAQKAELQYQYMGTLNDHHLIEVRPITGRPHQIRVQLANMGCPIRGDVKYGYPRPNEDSNIHLHARRLEFVHPVKKEPVSIMAGVPRTQFWEQFLQLDRKLTDKDIQRLL